MKYSTRIERTNAQIRMEVSLAFNIPLEDVIILSNSPHNFEVELPVVLSNNDEKKLYDILTGLKQIKNKKDKD